MKKNRFLVLAVFMSLVGLTSTASATGVYSKAVHDPIGQLIGVNGVVLEDDIWNVRFVDGTFNF